jgi:hypothetical protein
MFGFILNLLWRVQIYYGVPNELKYTGMGVKMERKLCEEEN